MKFRDLSRSDRMKALAMIGAIVLIVIFVTHTMLGAIKPKKNNMQSVQTVKPAAVINAKPIKEDTAVTNAFPMDKATETAKAQAAAGMLVPDPFEQLPQGGANPKPNSAPTAPVVSGQLQTVSVAGPTLPTSPSQGTVIAAQLQNTAPASPPPSLKKEPELRLIGLIHGDQPVATITVNGNTVIARPGDALALGWRLMAISEESVVVRHDGAMISVRVGGVLNEESKSN